MKQKTVYTCSNCGHTVSNWTGKCPNCGAWNTMTESQVSSKNPKKLKSNSLKSAQISRLKEIPTDEEFRIKTGINEFDRVLGGGIIPGSLILVGGDPGIGKSTLMLQMCQHLEADNILYITGEESLRQIKFRADRLENIPEDILLLAETNLETINSTIKSSSANIIIIDSIQSIYSDMLDATPGSVAQVRECASLLMQTAKTTNKAIIVIGHVTKEGVIAGPKILEHTVDTVLQFEGEKTYSFRILRSIKNRFGSTNEIGIFEMSDKGLREVKNPSEVFLGGRSNNESGIAIVSAMEGTRPILLEVQALVSHTGYSVPQRTANGFDNRRLQMIIAVLEKRIGLQFRQNDVFVNIAGGVYLNDTSIDLGIAVALVSSLKDMPMDRKTVLIGEIGLTGEIRSVASLEARIKEAEKLGFNNAVIPNINMEQYKNKFKINLINFDRISNALAKIL
jgi:DNA repair protein RadA/Sms